MESRTFVTSSFLLLSCLGFFSVSFSRTAIDGLMGAGRCRLNSTGDITARSCIGFWRGGGCGDDLWPLA